jgi:molybdopterin molybdotransferase
MGFDIVLLSGGISVGDYDIVQDALLRIGIQKVFWKVKIQPGKPLFLGRRRGQLIFALPGNPVSAIVNFLLFVRPVLDKMMGRQSVGLRKGEAQVLEERPIKPGRRKFLRARLEWHHGTLGVRILPYQASGVLRSMVEADALVDVPEEVECLRQGDLVNILYLDYHN